MKRPLLVFGIAASLAFAALAMGRTPAPARLPGLAGGPAAPSGYTSTGLAVVGTEGSLKLTAHLSDPVLGPDATDEYLLMDIVGTDVAGAARSRAPVNLAVALDCSGSMQGEKLDNAQRAAHELVDRLNENDRLAFVAFGTGTTTLFPSSVCTPGAKAEMHQALNRLTQMGGTDISGGLQAAIAEVKARVEQYPVDRVILISDGQANQGITSHVGLSELSRQARRSGVSVTALGVGVDYDEELMGQLAAYGGGNYGFLRTGGDLQAVFSKELDQLATQVASDPRLTLRPAEGVRVEEVYGYAFEKEASGDTVVQLNDVAAGAHYRVLVRLSLPTHASGAMHLADARLGYTDLVHDRASVTAGVALNAETTGDAVAALRSRDQIIYRQVLVGNAASVAKSIAALYGTGQVAQAQQRLESARAQLSRQVSELGLPGVQEEVDRMLPSAPLPTSSSSEAGRVKTIQMHRNIVDFASCSTVAS